MDIPSVLPSMNNGIPWLDIASKIGLLFIAIFNFVFAVYIFIFRNIKEKQNREKDRKINLLKTLILDHALKHLYNFFDQLAVKTEKLKNEKLEKKEKSIINEDLLSYFSCFRTNFIDSLIAIDRRLYDDILKETDYLQDHFSKSIFDEGINLYDQNKFKEIIEDQIRNTKTEILKLLFSYKGE